MWTCTKQAAVYLGMRSGGSYSTATISEEIIVGRRFCEMLRRWEAVRRHFSMSSNVVVKRGKKEHMRERKIENVARGTETEGK